MERDPSGADRRLRFGPFLVDPRRRLLWRSGVLLPITPRAFEILSTLIERRPGIVTKDELLEHIWPDTAVGENTLTRHISTLRKVLEERPDQHEYIVTIPGHGYQFVAEVSDADEQSSEPRPHTIAAEGLHPQPSPSFIGRSAELRYAAIAGGLSLAIIAAVGLLTFRFREANRPAPDRVLRQFTYHSGLQREPTWSPDGQSIAYTSDRAGNSDIWVQALGDQSPVRITTSPAEDSQADWSPDGQSLAFRSERDGGGLFVVSARGGDPRLVATFGYKPRWSPDGSMLLFSSSGHIGGTARMYVVPVNGGEARPVRPELLDSLHAEHVAWKPGGRLISIMHRDTIGRLTFLTTSIDGGAPTASTISPEIQQRFISAELTVDRFVWSTSTRYLYFEGASHQVRNLWRVRVDPATLAWIDGPERLTTATGDSGDIALSPDGTRVAFSARTSRTRLWSYPFDAASGQITGAGQPVTSGGAGEQDADTPDDGSKLVYRVVRGGRQEIWERSIADGSEHLLISSPGWFRTRPHWSPDGMNVAYARRRANARGPLTDAVVAVLATRGGEERLLTKPGHLNLIPTDWSPDGRWLLGACKRSPADPPAVCVMPASESPDGDSHIRIVASDPSKNLFEHRFSPDQRWISFIAVKTTDAWASTIYVVPAAGGVWTPITEGLSYDDKPHWAPDGRTLYFVSNREGFFNVWGRRIDPASGAPAGDPFRVTSFNSPRETLSAQLSQMQIALTSHRLFLPITEDAGELWVLDNVDR